MDEQNKQMSQEEIDAEGTKQAEAQMEAVNVLSEDLLEIMKKAASSNVPLLTIAKILSNAVIDLQAQQAAVQAQYVVANMFSQAQAAASDPNSEENIRRKILM